MASAMERKEQPVWHTLKYSEAPPWLRTNDCIHTGYTPPMKSYTEAASAIFRIHNETVNIWSHLIASICVVIGMLVFYMKPFCEMCSQEATFAQKSGSIFSFLGFFAVFSCSVVCHSLCAISEELNRFLIRVDLACIMLSILGMHLSMAFYIFHDDQFTRVASMAAITLCCCFVIKQVMFNDVRSPLRRGLIFGTSILVTFLPFYWYLQTHGFGGIISWNDSVLYLAGLASELTGLVFYVSRVPEILFPGKFDLLFNSHQFLHFFCAVGSFYHLSSIVNLFYSAYVRN